MEFSSDYVMHGSIVPYIKYTFLLLERVKNWNISTLLKKAMTHQTQSYINIFKIKCTLKKTKAYNDLLSGLCKYIFAGGEECSKKNQLNCHEIKHIYYIFIS